MTQDNVEVVVASERMLQGSQSTMTGGFSTRTARLARSACWLRRAFARVDHAFGKAVDPEVNRILAIVSGAMRSYAAST